MRRYPCWTVFRLDDDGNHYLVAAFSDIYDARYEQARLAEANKHTAYILAEGYVEYGS